MSTNKRIGDLLVEKGLLTPAQLHAVLEEQTKTGQRLGQILLAKNWISEDDLVDVIHNRLGIPKISLENIVIDPKIVELVPLAIAKKHNSDSGVSHRHDFDCGDGRSARYHCA